MIVHFFWLIIWTLIQTSRQTSNGEENVIQLLSQEERYSIRSSITTYEESTRNSIARWSRCQSCQLKNNSIALFNQKNLPFLRYSHARAYCPYLFPHSGHECRHIIEFVSDWKSRPKYRITRPLILISINDFDLISLFRLFSSLYDQMIQVYGQVRQDSLLILDTKNTFEFEFACNHDDSICQLFRVFTRIPMYTTSYLQSYTNHSAVLFDDLIIGASEEYNQYDHDNDNECKGSIPFIDYIMRNHTSQKSETLNILLDISEIVSGRIDMNALVEYVCRNNSLLHVSCRILDISSLRLSAYIDVMKSTDIFVLDPYSTNDVFYRRTGVFYVIIHPFPIDMLYSSCRNQYHIDASTSNIQWKILTRRYWHQQNIAHISMNTSHVYEELSIVFSKLSTVSEVRDPSFDTEYLVESYISYVSVSTHTKSTWVVSISGLVSAVDMRLIGESIPWMSICIDFKNVQHFNITCVPVKDLAFGAKLSSYVYYPVIYLHIWLQTSRIPFRGKLKHSDDFIVVNSRFQDGGMAYWRIAPSFHVNDMHPSILCQSMLPNYTYQHTRNEHSLQESIHEYCRLNEMSDQCCMHAVVNIYRQIMDASINRNIYRDVPFPMIQSMPSPQYPFIFLHIEKTAGSTFREFLYESMEVFGLQGVIPCHGNISCTTFDLKSFDLSNVSIIAGHFGWDIWNELPNRSKDSPLACAVIGRHPVDRVISYYYQRCYLNKNCIGYNRPMNDLSTHELYEFMYYFRDSQYIPDLDVSVYIDEGLMDASCRSLSNKRIISGQIRNEHSSTFITSPHVLSMEDMNAALDNINQCVVGLQERWNDSMTILHYFFPWIDFSQNPQRRVLRLVSGQENRHTLRKELATLILELNPCDMSLYHQITRRFQQQFQSLHFSNQHDGN